MSHRLKPIAARKPPTSAGRNRTCVFGAPRRIMQKPSERITSTHSTRKTGKPAKRESPTAASNEAIFLSSTARTGTDEAATARNGRMMTTAR